MGAKDKKNDESSEIKLTDKQQRLFEEALATLRALVDDVHSEGVLIREWAIALTRMEDAEMWIERGFDALGIEPNIPEDDEDDGEDADDTDDEDEAESEEE